MKKLFSTATLLQIAGLYSLSVFSTNSVAQDIYKSNSDVLSCSPRVLRPNDTLTLSLGPRHGSELAINRMRDKVSFFLVVGGPPDNMTPLMTTDEFSHAKEVKISARAEALPWVSGSKKAPIFTKSGTYRIQVSNNLESEDGGYYCNVQYLAK